MNDVATFTWGHLQSSQSHWGPTSNTAVILADFVPLPETLEEKFQRLRTEWESETVNMSSLDKMFAHPAYQDIIKIGPKAIPLLLAELARSPNHWFYALRKITGENPIPKSAAGNLNKMALAWLKWGRKNGKL